ncbi:MAG TPA: hypothetical protein PKD61_02325, partial [Polyangiaceae bacterium]|nr:hypothetical protein [Polyangiaceae bacterium]
GCGECDGGQEAHTHFPSSPVRRGEKAGADCPAVIARCASYAALPAQAAERALAESQPPRASKLVVFQRLARLRSGVVGA